MGRSTAWTTVLRVSAAVAAYALQDSHRASQVAASADVASASTSSRTSSSSTAPAYLGRQPIGLDPPPLARDAELRAYDPTTTTRSASGSRERPPVIRRFADATMPTSSAGPASTRPTFHLHVADRSVAEIADYFPRDCAEKGSPPPFEPGRSRSPRPSQGPTADETKIHRAAAQAPRRPDRPLASTVPRGRDAASSGRSSKRALMSPPRLGPCRSPRASTTTRRWPSAGRRSSTTRSATRTPGSLLGRPHGRRVHARPHPGHGRCWASATGSWSRPTPASSSTLRASSPVATPPTSIAPCSQARGANRAGGNAKSPSRQRHPRVPRGSNVR